jgi:TetR/AcrR family transcriptional regulator, regulator of biofilm formation and stress response
MPAQSGSRAETSRKIRDAIVAATVRIVARDGVAAVTHRGVAAEAGVALSSTTWHFATKADILEAALHWTASQEVERIGAIADGLGDTDFDPAAWADELADWLVEQVTSEREVAVALYRLQVELLGSPGALAVHREWGERLLAVGERVLEHSRTATGELDVRLIVAALDGLRMGVLNSGEEDVEWLRPAVRRQLQALLG